MQTPPEFQEGVSHVAGTRIHHIEAGHGAVVLLIHGSLCDYRYWRWQIPDLSRHFHVVAPSLPGCWPEAVGPADGGHGQMDEPAANSRTPFSMERHVQAVVALCELLSPGRPVHLIGHSRGAQVAAEAALAMPGRIGRLVLADPGFPFAGEAPAQPVHAQIAGRLGHEPLDEVIGNFVDAVNGAGTWRQTVSWFKDMVRANAWTLLPQLADIHRSIDPGLLARVFDFPVLLAGGEFSPARYGSRIDMLMGMLPQARRVTVPRAAHGMNLANARYFNDAVLRFLLEG